MGDDEDRAAARGEVAREPVDALDVEVVGRLVEQQQLGVVEQRLGQRDPAPLAAARAARSACPAPAGSGDLDAAEQPVEHVAVARRRPSTRGRRGRRRAPRGSCASGSRSSPWPSIATCRPPTRVTAPASGSSTPAISRSSVDLPSPLRPTTPIRSPAEMPSVTSCQHGARGVALGGVLEVDEVARARSSAACSLRSSGGRARGRTSAPGRDRRGVRPSRSPR